MTQAIKRIPYGIADYRRMRQDNMYYVDKTRFLPLLEAAPYYCIFIRPRRFGKSLWLSLLDYYIHEDVAHKGNILFNHHIPIPPVHAHIHDVDRLDVFKGKLEGHEGVNTPRAHNFVPNTRFFQALNALHSLKHVCQTEFIPFSTV
ncbi:MAG: AAA family ATPase [Anaerolineae bacterium]|nr:AAA family ATPase [Anaerolineae bacterium]